MAFKIIPLTAPNPTVRLSGFGLTYDKYVDTISYQFHALIADPNNAGAWILDPKQSWVVNIIAGPPSTGAPYTLAAWVAMTNATQIANITTDMNTYFNNLAANAAIVASNPNLT